MPICRICQHTFKTLKFQTEHIGICTRCINTLNGSPEPAKNAEARLAELLARGMRRNAERDLAANEEWKRRKAQRVLADFDAAVAAALPGWITRLLDQPGNSTRDFKIMRAHRRGLLRMSGFARRLEGPEWEKVRLQVLHRDKRLCKVCGATDTTLDVHHIVYLSHHGTNQQRNLITLCRKCHELEHGRVFDWLEQAQENEGGIAGGERREQPERPDASLAETYEEIDPETGEITVRKNPQNDGEGDEIIVVPSNGSTSLGGVGGITAPADSNLKHWLNNKSTDTTPALARATPLRPLLADAGKDLPSAQAFLDTKLRMGAAREKWHAKADTTAQKWQKYRVLNKKENTELMDLMHEASLAQTDPAEAFKSILTDLDMQVLKGGRESHLPGLLEKAEEKLNLDSERKKAHDTLSKRFAALSPQAQAIYREVRDTYTELADDFDRVLLANLQKALDVSIRRAERAHKRELRRIDDEGMKGQDRADAIEDADKRLKKARVMGRMNTAARMRQMRIQFETQRIAGPYFPLARFGDYFVTVRNADGEVVSFSRFEKAGDQRQFADEMRQDKAYSVQTGVLDNSVELRKSVDANFVADVETILEGSGVPDSVRDAVWQRFLESMPDMSVRKNCIHGKGRAGFHQDALRAFSHHLFHDAYQLALIEYEIDLRDHVDEARVEAEVVKDPGGVDLVVNEMERHIAHLMNRPSAPPLEMHRAPEGDVRDRISKYRLSMDQRMWPIDLLVLLLMVFVLLLVVLLGK